MMGIVFISRSVCNFITDAKIRALIVASRAHEEVGRGYILQYACSPCWQTSLWQGFRCAVADDDDDSLIWLDDKGKHGRTSVHYHISLH